jgi:hypothetical protein
MRVEVVNFQKIINNSQFFPLLKLYEFHHFHRLFYTEFQIFKSFLIRLNSPFFQYFPTSNSKSKPFYQHFLSENPTIPHHSTQNSHKNTICRH